MYCSSWCGLKITGFTRILLMLNLHVLGALLWDNLLMGASQDMRLDFSCFSLFFVFYRLMYWLVCFAIDCLTQRVERQT